MISKRDIVIALISCCVTCAVVASAQKTGVLMSSAVFDWDKVGVKETATGATRDFFKGPTATLDQLECHVTTVKAGEASHGSHWIIDLPIANPMSVYEEYKAERTSWGINALGTVVVQVELTDGTIGVGCSIGGEPACYIIEKHLSRFVEGQDPRNVELIWDQMWRATMPYGRKGLTVQAISAVDLAIWDCLGKLRDEPVYALIGGKTKERLPVYATTSRPDIAKQWGFNGAKIPCRYGPAEGKEGLRKNIAVMEEARAQVGPDFPLRLDCYMCMRSR